MKIKSIKYFGLLLIMLFSISCNDKFLDLAPGQDLSEDDVFKEYNNFRKYSDYNYQYQQHFAFIGRMWNVLQATMSDEASSSAASNSTSAMRAGNWFQNNNNWRAETDNMYSNMYQGIRRTNMVIARIDEVANFPSDAVKNQMLGENYFLRAQFYFELVKRYGGVPLVLRPLSGEENLDLPRNTYEECVNAIVADCDKAASLLPQVYPDSENGRATLGAALALKSRMLLYAASPLNNPTKDVAKWQAAANAAKAVMDLNLYSLYPDLHELFFQPTCSEVILNKPRPKMRFDQGITSGIWVRFIATSGYNAWNTTSINQNFIDLHESANGYPIADARGNYNPNDPYANRDPRLKINYLVNNETWQGRKTEFYVGGKDESNAGKDKNLTGYSLRKFWPQNFLRNTTATTYLNYIMFRYAEILLNYAEALNEVEGPTAAVRAAVNQVRARAGQVPIPTDISDTKDAMRLRIQNERSVELAFEEHRFYDLLRWEKGVEALNGPMYGMRIVKNANNTFSYSKIVVETRVFYDYMHRYPLPMAEIFKSKGVLKQNPGWPQ